MKKSVTFKTIANAAILLLALIPFLFTSSCQKEEQLIMESDFISVNQLKSATVSADEIDDLIFKIENYVNDGKLEPGIANSFISKLKNAKKSLEKGKETAATNLLNALQNQLEALISEGTIDAFMGGGLILDIQEITGEWTCGQPFVDYRDGKVYQTVKIGDQCWMAENLAYDVGDGCWAYDNDEDNVETYGRLYTWEAANAACPEGWHLPSNDEWNQLEEYLIENGYSYDGIEGNTGIAKSMAATILWSTSSVTGAIGNDLSANNSSGFSALPGGIRSGTIFSGVEDYGWWWSSTEFSSEYPYSGVHIAHILNHDSNFVSAGYDTNGNFSVRCVRD